MVHFSVIVLNRSLEQFYSEGYCPERRDVIRHLVQFRQAKKQATFSATAVVQTDFVYPSCLHAVAVCCWVQPSPHTLLQPAPGLCTCRMCRGDMRRTVGEVDWRGAVVCYFFPTTCLCVRTLTKRDNVACLTLPGKVVLTLKLDTQVISSSPPLQSSIPSQAWSMGMNLTERLQKKYLLSMNFLTAQRKGHKGRSDDMKR